MGQKKTTFTVPQQVHLQVTSLTTFYNYEGEFKLK